MSAQTRSKKSQAKDPGGGGGGTSDIESTLSKDEQAIARFLRLNCGTKQGNLAGMKVEFFIANKLVDQLMESKWGPGKPSSATPAVNDKKSKTGSNKESLLSNRAACVSLMQRLMNKQLFYRAYKVYKDEVETTAGGSGNESTSEKTPNLRKRKKEKELAAAESTPAAAAASSDSTPKPGETTPQKETKRKFKLELHQDQKFVDGNEPYVWIYDPISTKSYIIGALLILGAIGICLFPLWPSQVREGVYYLSVAGASFLGAILAIAVIKYVLYALVWTLTLGKCQFWLFPNLTEDVGFIESFIPVYKVICSSSTSSSTSPTKTEQTTSEPNSLETKEQPVLRSSGMSTSMTTSSMQTRKGAAVMNELSKSTVEISTNGSSSSSSRNSTESPSVNKNRKSSLTASTLARDEEDFELVDNEELNNK